MSGLPARTHAPGANPVSTADGVGPVGSHVQIGHLIEEASEVDPAHVPDGRPVRPGAAWCAQNRRQGVLTEALGW